MLRNCECCVENVENLLAHPPNYAPVIFPFLLSNCHEAEGITFFEHLQTVEKVLMEPWNEQKVLEVDCALLFSSVRPILTLNSKSD